MGSSTDTRNFGMRRFTNLVREGRFRAPAATALMLGTAVEIDPGATDRVRQVTANGIGVGGADVRSRLVGVLWYEHDSQTYNRPEWGGAAGLLAQDLNRAPVNRMVQVLHGPGVKVWFRNTLASTPESGLNFPNSRPAVTMVTGIAGLTVGQLLGWGVGAVAYAVTTNTAEAIFRVTNVNASTLTCDAELLV